MFRFRHKKQATTKTARFTVPVSDPFENPLVETDPAQLRLWASTLPRSNNEQLCETLINSLSRLNRFPGAVKRREELMEIYHEPCSQIYLNKHEGKNTLPSKMKRLLVMELAYGHLHLINEILCEAITPKAQKRLHTHLHFAIKFLALEHMFACVAYDCRNSSTLRELTRLHTLAVEQNLHETPLDEKSPDNTIARQLKCTLLLDLLDPCILQQDEASMVTDYLSAFANLARFESLEKLKDTTGYYVIDSLGEVAPHLYDATGTTSLKSPRFFLFDLNPVSQRLHKDLRVIEKQDNLRPDGLRHLSNKAAISLLRRMLKSWHIRSKRGGERHKTSGQVILWIGLDPIHGTLIDSEENSVNDPYDDENNIVIGSEDQEPTHAIFRKIDCWRFNMSRSGVALHLPLSQTVVPKVGELVMITNPDEASLGERKVGIIRRALAQDNLLEIGIQFINDRLTPITLQAEESAPGTANFPALYLGMGDIERSSLIIARDKVEIGRSYRVDEMVPAPAITPVHLLEVTGMFERYRVKRT